MDDELPAAFSLLLPLVVVLGSLLHDLYTALFARFGLVNRRLFPWGRDASSSLKIIRGAGISS